MKPLLRKVPVEPGTSFSIRRDLKPHFTGIGHYHPELELHYILRGDGVRFIGNRVSNFKPGELVLLGENLPHTWRSSEQYHNNDPSQRIEVIVINFLPDFLGPQFLFKPETMMLQRLFERARSGLEIFGEARSSVAELMLESLYAEGLSRFIILLKILKILAETSDYRYIVQGDYTSHRPAELDSARLNSVYNYTLSNYMKDIKLEQLAVMTNFTVTSFCRYFKSVTRKTYWDFLTEIRIGNACRLLIEDKLSTEAVCFECGFQNISNFYRHFKRIIGISPVEYKKKYLRYQP